MAEENIPTQAEIKTPKWLRRLEKESWQAELLVSGLALFGSLQLPEITYWLIDLLIKNLPHEQYSWGSVIAFANLFGISILSTFFIIHLLLRAYWIGLIGLNSVYPEGIRVENELYSRIYTEKTIDILPKIPTTINQVDEICSTLFSSAFAFLMLYGGFSLLAIPLIFLYNFLAEYVATFFLRIPIYLFAAFFILLSMLSLLSLNKKIKENERVQHFYFSATQKLIWFTPFFGLVNQIMMTLTTNKKYRSNFLYSLIFLACAGALTSVHFRSSNISILEKGKGADHSFFQKDKMYSDFYENQYLEGKEILNPIITSDQIRGKFLSVFIPVFKNEKFIRNTLCEAYVPDTTKSGDDNRKMKNEQRIFCYRKYHKIYVNDSLYQVELLHKNHTNKDEFGVVGYIPTDDFRIGKNTLEVVKVQDEKGTIFQRTEIPFWFEGE